MSTPTLVILAAGLGSRFGGLKQTAFIDEEKNTIIDYSVFDAKRAGFERVVYVINPIHEAEFKEIIGNKVSVCMDVQYAYQEIDSLPKGYFVPDGRKKPWGTAHAVLAAKDFITDSFAVINADDFYGASSMQQIYDALQDDITPKRCAMVGFRLENTLTENGSVSRGVCETDENSDLSSIVERTKIMPCPGGAIYADGEKEQFLEKGTIVSMNLWGFDKSFIGEIERRFISFLTAGLAENPLTCEFFLPFVVDDLIKEGALKAKVKVSKEKWLGITYAKDLDAVRSAVSQLKDDGVYPRKLWK